MTQYSMPEYDWSRLRRRLRDNANRMPTSYPTSAHMKVEVVGTKARLYVAARQPVLLVNDLKHGDSTGAVALWIHYAERLFCDRDGASSGLGMSSSCSGSGLARVSSWLGASTGTNHTL